MKQYLGDGLYFSDDGHMVTLSTVREGGSQHFVCLEFEVLIAFFDALAESRKLEISVKRKETQECEE